MNKIISFWTSVQRNGNLRLKTKSNLAIISFKISVPPNFNIDHESFREYSRFRDNILNHLNGGHPQGSAASDLSLAQEFLLDDESELPLQERRKKNNEAAKRSRDSRRAKEDEIAIRAAFLGEYNFLM